MTGYPFASMIRDSSEQSFPFSIERETEMEKPSKWKIQSEREREDKGEMDLRGMT